MMGGGGGQQQLQQLSQELQAIDEEIEEVEGEIQELQNEKSEIDEAVEAIETLESGSTVQVPLGGDAYVRATVDDIDEIVVSLGGGYAAERDQDGAVDTLETKQETLDGHIEGLRDDKAKVEGEMDELEQQAQQMQQQQMQQMMQQQEEQQSDE